MPSLSVPSLGFKLNPVFFLSDLVLKKAIEKSIVQEPLFYWYVYFLTDTQP